MLSIDSEIGSILVNSSGIPNTTDANRLLALKNKKGKFLTQEVLTLRLKSKALWISEGDANTKFFHSFASARRNKKTIWSLTHHEGNLISNDPPPYLKGWGKNISLNSLRMMAVPTSLIS